MLAVSILGSKIIQRNDMQTINTLYMVSPVRYDYHASADSDEFRMLHWNSSSVRQADLKWFKGRLQKSLANCFYA